MKERTLREIFEDIKVLDIQPPLFRVTLYMAPHIDGYSAVAEFRYGHHESAVNDCSTRADDPVETLLQLERELQIRFGRCVHCGKHREGN